MATIQEKVAAKVTAGEITDTQGDWLLERQAELDAKQARIEANAPTPPECPSWCVLPSGHEYDAITNDERSYIRHHDSINDGPNQPAAWITAQEMNTLGVVTLEAPSICCSEVWLARLHEAMEAAK